MPTPNPSEHPSVLRLRLDTLDERVSKHRNEVQLKLDAHEATLVELRDFKIRVETGTKLALLVWPLLGSVIGSVLAAIIVMAIKGH